MSKIYRTFSLLLVFLSLTSFKSDKECKYAGANIDFVKSQTEKALENIDINILRYHAFKAINAIQKTEKKLSDCGCTYAEEGLQNSIRNLKLATKEENIDVAKDLLSMSLESTMESLNQLKEHEFHRNVNTERSNEITSNKFENGNSTTYKPVKAIYTKIDKSLEKYKNSLNTVVETVDCKEAHSFTKNIVEQCENQLLSETLTEGKKYYYLRTKEITLGAMERLNDCVSK